jgi:hypothetical protein
VCLAVCALPAPPLRSSMQALTVLPGVSSCTLVCGADGCAGATAVSHLHASVSGTAVPAHVAQVAQGGAVAAEPARGNRRWVIVGLCFVAFMLCNMDRVNMSIAILPMSKQFGWDSATIGLVQSSFFWCAAPPSRPPRPCAVCHASMPSASAPGLVHVDNMYVPACALLYSHVLTTVCARLAHVYTLYLPQSSPRGRLMHTMQ